MRWTLEKWRVGYLDFNSSLLFHNGITNIAHPATKKVCLHYTYYIDKYLDTIRYLFDCRQLLHAATEIETLAREGRQNKSLEKKYNDVDQEMTNIMLSIEIVCSPT